ncbi:MAG: hypothetical protein H7203_14955 [Rhizobacter sp.]|nr:hypothetical protein [Burkholderiales bacterium]
MANYHKKQLVHAVSRRSFLLLAPLAAVATLTPTIALGQTGTPVGVLLPNNERIPGLRLDWRRGFQSELLAANAAFQPQYVEYSVGPYRALAAAQSLLERGFTTLTGIFNRNLATSLGESLDRHSAKFLVSDLGANAIRGDPCCHRLTRVGPNLWQQAYLAGQHFARLGAKRALIASSFYEAGYDLPGAFQSGFLSAGGSAAEIVVTGTPDIATNDREFASLAKTLSGRRFDVLFSLYSGREATRYLAYAQTISAQVGTLVALSPLLHGLPQSAVTKAAAMAVEVVTPRAANDNTVNAGETTSTVMGRVAARAVMAAMDSPSQSGLEWHATVAPTKVGSSTFGSATNTTATFDAAAMASPWSSKMTSGWIAPYGA